MTETETLTVQQAWAAVMAEVRELAKGDRNASQGFNFRGVDAVMNAVGPALRRHGVSVVPTAVTHTAEEVTTSKGARMRNVTVVVSYAINGPAGDTMPGAAAGEAADSGDKATPKAMSVAYRTFLLQSLTLPTHDTDPDAESYERGAAPAQETPQQTAARGIAQAQTVEVLEQVLAWAQSNGVQVPADVVQQRREQLQGGAAA